MRALVAFAAMLGMHLLSACVSAPGAQTLPPADVFVEPSDAIHAVAFSADGERLIYAIGVRGCQVRSLEVATGDSSDLRELTFCPERLTSFADGSLLAAGGNSSEWLGADGNVLFEGRVILAARGPTQFLERAANGLLWQDGESSTRLDAVELRSPRIAEDGVLLAIEVRPDGERLVRFDSAGPTVLTPTFESIDSWDMAPRGDEMVLSARVGSSFDVGIVSSSGGEINWIAPDDADQRNVTWAPRGNKITYTFESVDATLVRSVHVPTGFQVLFDLPLTMVRHVAWEPKAERFAIAIESPDRGPRIDWVGYQGESRSNLVTAAEAVDTTIEAILWSGGSGVLLRPGTVRYGEIAPTVLWIEGDEPFAWRPEVVALRKKGIPVMTTTARRLGEPSSAFSEIPWVSPSHLYIVDVPGSSVHAASGLEYARLFVRQGSTGGRIEVIPGDAAAFRAGAARRIQSMEEAGQ